VHFIMHLQPSLFSALTGLDEVEGQMVNVALHHLQRVLRLGHALSNGLQHGRCQQFRPIKLRSWALVVRGRDT